MKKCRLRAGLSQEDLAERLNYSRSCISKVESDRKGLYFQDALKWFQETGAQDVALAFVTGMDAVSILQSIFDVGAGLVNLYLMVA